MGMLYRPKYRNAAGELVESSKWWIKFYVNSKPVRENTKTDKEAKARNLLKLREGEAVKGVPFIAKVNQKTVGALFDDVIADYSNQGHDTLKETERRVRMHLRPFFGTWNAASVTDDQVRRYITELSANRPAPRMPRSTASWPSYGGAIH